MARKKKEEFSLSVAEKNNLRMEYKSVDELLPYARNAKVHTPEQISKIASSIKEFGFINPVIVKENTILAGHGRIEGAKKLGMEKVPTIDASYLTEAQKKAYILADNRIAEQDTHWDTEMLGLELEELKELDFDVDSLMDFGDLFPTGDGDTTGGGKKGDELDIDNFSEFEHTCPKCGFGFDGKGKKQ